MPVVGSADRHRAVSDIKPQSQPLWIAARIARSGNRVEGTNKAGMRGRESRTRQKSLTEAPALMPRVERPLLQIKGTPQLNSQLPHQEFLAILEPMVEWRCARFIGVNQATVPRPA